VLSTSQFPVPSRPAKIAPSREQNSSYLAAKNTPIWNYKSNASEIAAEILFFSNKGNPFFIVKKKGRKQLQKQSDRKDPPHLTSKN